MLSNRQTDPTIMPSLLRMSTEDNKALANSPPPSPLSLYPSSHFQGSDVLDQRMPTACHQLKILLQTLLKYRGMWVEQSITSCTLYLVHVHINHGGGIHVRTRQSVVLDLLWYCSGGVYMYLLLYILSLPSLSLPPLSHSLPLPTSFHLCFPLPLSPPSPLFLPILRMN